MTAAAATRFSLGERISFAPSQGGPVRYGSVVGRGTRRTVSALLDGDPFPVKLNVSQVKGPPGREEGKMAKVTVKELRKRAEKYKVPGWEEMSLSDLRIAVKKASAKAKAGDNSSNSKGGNGKSIKSAAKKPAAKKVAAKTEKAAAKRVAKPKPKDKAQGPYSYRSGTQRAIMADLLIEGTTEKAFKEAIVKKLRRRDGRPFTEKDTGPFLSWLSWHMTSHEGFELEREEGKNGEVRLRMVPGGRS